MNYLKMIWNLWQLKRNEKKSAEEISALQAEKQKRLLHYAYEHSPYYRKSFEQAGITAEKIDSTPLSSFPTIDKSVFMSQFEEIVTVTELTQIFGRCFQGRGFKRFFTRNRTEGNLAADEGYFEGERSGICAVLCEICF